MFVVNDAVFSLLETQSKNVYVCVDTRQKERQNDLVEKGYWISVKQQKQKRRTAKNNMGMISHSGALSLCF